MKSTVALYDAFYLFMVIFPTPILARDQEDPPSRAARLGYVEGSILFEPAGEQDWVQADPDRPMTAGDTGTALWLGSQTGISFLNLNDQAVQVQLAQGWVPQSCLTLSCQPG